MWIADLTWLPAQGEVESWGRPREDSKHSSSGSYLNVSSQWWPSTELHSGKIQSSTNKQSNTYFSEDMTSVFPDCLQNSDFFLRNLQKQWNLSSVLDLSFVGGLLVVVYPEGRMLFLTLEVTWNIKSEISFCMVWGQKGHSCFEPSFAQILSILNSSGG